MWIGPVKNSNEEWEFWAVIAAVIFCDLQKLQNLHGVGDRQESRNSERKTT